MLRRIKIIPLFMIDQDDSFGYLWKSRWGAGEDSGGRKKAYLTWQKKKPGQTERTREGNLQISLRWGFWRAFPEMKGRDN